MYSKSVFFCKNTIDGILNVYYNVNCRVFVSNTGIGGGIWIIRELNRFVRVKGIHKRR